jgi:ferritin
MSAIKANIDQFLAASNFNIKKISKGKTITKDIRPFVQMLSLDRDKKIIKFIVSFVQEGSARPVDIIAHILKSDPDESRQIRVVKTKTLLG